MRLFRLTLAASLMLLTASACGTSDDGSSGGGSSVSGEPSTAIDAVAAATAPATPTEMPPGFYFNGEFIALGEFDPDSPVELINMCDDLPDEVLHAAGMQRVEASEAMTSRGNLTCVFLPLDSNVDRGTNGFMAVRTPVSRFYELDYVLTEDASESVPGLFTHVLDTAYEDECWASVSTEKGLVGFDYQSFDPSLTLQNLCDRAVQTLETVYYLLQENN